MNSFCRTVATIAIACITTVWAEDAGPKAIKELNGLLGSIHKELLKLRASTPWLSAYDQTCLSESDGKLSLYYHSKEAERKGPEPQQSSHFTLTYIDLNQPRRFKQWNSFEDSPVCRFPGWQAKIYGEVLVWEDRKLEERLKGLVIAKCADMQRRQNAATPATSPPKTQPPRASKSKAEEFRTAGAEIYH